MSDWRIQGEELGSCNCDWGCPCQFSAKPTNGYCEAFVGWQISEGHFGDTSLDGVKFAYLYSWPGPIEEGNGSRQLIVDESASEGQRAALAALDTGEEGGAYFEVFASVTPDRRDPISAPIELELDRERRVGSLTVAGIGESRVEPIKNAATGEEHRARIDLPNGFEYKIAEIANTVKAEAKADDPLSLSLENTYAQLAEIDWSNA